MTSPDDNMDQTPRQRVLMDPEWRFHLGDVLLDVPLSHRDTYMWVKCGLTQGVPDPEFDDSEWQLVDLPHDWVVGQRFDPRNNPDHGFLPTGIGWYRKTFSLPQSDTDKHLWVEFDGVFRNSTVWLNGYLLGTHPSGYIGFRYDITDIANYGGENVIAVRVDATEFEGWWYEGGGIYRHVWLVKANPVHIAPWGTFVTATVPAPLEPQHSDVVVNTTLENDSVQDVSCELHSVVLDAEGKEVAAAESPVMIPAGESRELIHEVTVADPQLWSVDRPYLYRVLTTVQAEGRIVDSDETTFGIRTIKFDPQRGFFLNGKPLKLKGTCNHQDHAGVGIALPDRIHEYRIERLKQMGANAYRCAHNPPAPELLDACDRLGMLVMDENRYLSSSPHHLADLASMIRRDRNHPSIIMWSLGNEEMIQSTEAGARIATTMKRLIRKLDPTRPVTYAMHDDWGEGLSPVLDVQGCNYHSQDYDAYHEEHPEHPMVASETSAAFGTRGIYQTDEAQGYFSAYDVNPAWFGNTAEAAWQAVAARPFVAGTFVWTGFGYRGEPDPYSWPCIDSHFSIMDPCGFPKDNYYYYQSWWSEETILHLFPHWNWPGREEEAIEVWCHSNCDSVELFLNGESLGRQQIPRNGHLEWQVEYAPGTLSAHGHRGDEVIVTTVVETTGAAAGIVLTPDRAVIKANGQDVAIVIVSIIDSKGRVVPTADNEVSFHVSENAIILGVGNGNPSSHEPDKASRRRAFNGLVQVIIQASRRAGDVTLTAESPGLLPATIIITTEHIGSNTPRPDEC